MKILIASDGSEHSDFAIEDTIKQSWPSDTSFRIISVVDNSFMPSSSDDKQTIFAQSVVNRSVIRMQEAFNQSTNIEGQVLHGYPKSEIVKCAEDWRPDLLIVGSRGRKGLKRVLLGSVSHSLLMAVSCSVRIARPGNDVSPQRILLSLDTSDVSQLVIDRIAARPWLEGTQFLCVTAVPSLRQYFYEKQDSHEVDSLEAFRNAQVEATSSRLEKTVQLLQSKLPNVLVSQEILDGDPREAVVEKSNKWQANLIVIGCKGKNWMDRVLIGSVSESIATWATCTVEVVK